MSKELEEYKYSNLELLREIWFNVPEGSQKIHQKHFDLILSKLNELQVIKESKPSVALELVGYLKDYLLNMIPYCDWLNDIEKYILKAQEQEKVLEIIFEKNVDIRALKYTSTYKEYNNRLLDLNPTKTTDKYLLTQEEFDLLKRYCDEQDNK